MAKRWVVGGLLGLAVGCGQRTESGSPGEDNVARAQLPATASMVWDKQARLTSTDELSGDFFGTSLALDGTTAVVGAPGKLLVGARDSAGAVYTFVRSGTTWTQRHKLTLDDPLTHGFGSAVALSGDTLLTTTVNYSTELAKAMVLTRDGDSWLPQAELVPPTAYVGVDQFGIALALDGDTALVGAHGKDAWAGAAYVFERSGTTWDSGTRLERTDAAGYDYLGYSVALSGDTALVGAYGKNTAQGAAYVFVRGAAGWKQQAKLVASDPVDLDQFGFSVAIDGDTALVGANFKASESGAAYVFVRSGTTWTQQQKLVASDSTVDHHFGASVAVKADMAIVGAKYTDLHDGSAYVFKRSGATWTEQQKLRGFTTDPEYAFGFGQAVAIEGTYALVGAERSNASTGAVYAFRRALAQGSDCGQESECQSGYCTDGVCCDTACQEECRACAQSLTGKPDGECQPIPADQDPESECDADPAYPESCGADGFCNGSGECRAVAPAGLACGAAECSAGRLVRKTCSAAGECVDDVHPCAPYSCRSAASGCGTSCSTQGDCDDDSYCSAGSCLPMRSQGVDCDRADECASGFCVDGVCCDGACDGVCEACAEAGRRGTCQAVSGAPRGARPGCDSATSECAGACDGTTRDTCSYPGATTTCGRPCVDGITVTKSCDGQGGCVEVRREECGAYACGRDGCRTTCLSDKQCAAGFSCRGSECIQAMPAECTKDADCDAGQRCESASKTCRADDSPRPASPPKADSGCGCRLAGSPGGPYPSPAWLSLAALVLALRRRTTTRGGARPQTE